RAARLEAVVQLGELRRRQGRFDEAAALFAQAEFHPSAIAGRARMQLSAGDPMGAWATIRGLLERLPPDGRLARADVLLLAVLAACAAGDQDVARHLAAELRETAALTGTNPLMAAACAADAALAPPDGAVVLLTEAVRRFSAADLRFDEAHTRLALAEALLAAGDRPTALRHLVLATEVLDELSAGDDLAHARRLSDAAAAPSGGALSEREREVLRLVSDGLSNHEIAVSLVLSQHTVHRHVANILTKLGQASRAGAASYAIRAGLL
ncbi:MAG: response regulator transcription factor, partial [Cellulomonadaceae bacterium]|nr:response regulator transcription factor [Cellulomonadaceae bacterium]